MEEATYKGAFHGLLFTSSSLRRQVACWVTMWRGPAYHEEGNPYTDPQMIAVRMDVHMPGAEEWKNEFQLTPDDLGFLYEGGQVFDALEDLFHYFFSAD